MLDPLPLNTLVVFAGVFGAVDAGAAGFWMKSMHDVEILLVQVVPQLVPGEHKFMVPDLTLTVA